MADGDALLTDQDLARTYDGGVYDDAWMAVREYRDVIRYQTENPDKGYTAIANALDLPKGRVRSWTDGKTPNVVAGIETARDRGWIDVGYEDDAFLALNALVAGIFSGGSIIRTNWIPKWTLNEQGYHSYIVDALELADVGYTTHEEADENSGPTIRPADDGAILGRVLCVLGAPIGKKSELDDITLPWYLDDAPTDVREMFVHSYIANRGYGDRESARIQIIEDRSQSYRKSLAALLEDVAGAPVTLGDRSITISADAARALGIEQDWFAREGF
ncbi:hypothetical protein [Halosolutus halophilus]|uniref:hypothetical protein n=1 Tax=Halosolutus halophilus TaxID=1552990 RepID=UPI0022352067|nr:hypothetical protein [Halosolutus halophilus]